MSEAIRESVKPRRLLSLDVLRGITVAVMILVNNNGSGEHAYRTLLHSPWNGCTLADVVFPTFLFIVGTSIVLAFRARLAKGGSRASLMQSAARRAATIFLLGLLINTFPEFEMGTLRIYGVLQRIAICFLFAAAIELFASVRVAAIVCVGILVGYWALLRFVPVPGFGVPGRDIALLDPVGNIVAYVDRHLLAANHLYRQSFYDPEGLLSTVSALATTLLGVLTGHWLLSARAAVAKARGLLVGALLCLATAAVWQVWLPLNKRLWTSSYVLFAAGIAMLLFAILYQAVDVGGSNAKWTYPALVFGSNALTAYVFSELLASTVDNIDLSFAGRSVDLQTWAFLWLGRAIPNQAVASLAYSLLFVGICFVPILVLYHKRIFLKV